MVTVTGDGPDQTTVISFDEISGMLEAEWSGTYRWRPREDEPIVNVARQEIGGRLTISALLARVGVPSDSVKYAVVDGGGTRRSELEHDLGDFDARDDGLEPSFFTSGSGGSAGIGFVRTLRSPGEIDPFDGYWLAPGRAPVVVTVSTKGKLLHPEITACSPFVAGKPCALTAVLVPPVSGATYSWRFESTYSTPVVGSATASHTYADGGPYEVLVEVKAADGSMGLGRKVIGKPTVSKTGGELGGGQGTKPNSPNTGPKKGDGTKPGGKPTSGPSGVGSPGGGSGTPGTGSTSGSTTGPTTGTTPTADPEPSPPAPADDRPELTGVVLAGPGITTTYLSEEQGTQTPAAARRYAPHRSWALPLGALAVLTLLGAGAVSETRLASGLAGRWRRST